MLTHLFSMLLLFSEGDIIVFQPLKITLETGFMILMIFMLLLSIISRIFSPPFQQLFSPPSFHPLLFLLLILMLLFLLKMRFILLSWILNLLKPLGLMDSNPLSSNNLGILFIILWIKTFKKLFFMRRFPWIGTTL